VSFGALIWRVRPFNDSSFSGTFAWRMNASLVYNTGSNENWPKRPEYDYPVWTGASGADWNTTASNWELASNSLATTYIEGDNVVFDDTAARNSI